MSNTDRARAGPAPSYGNPRNAVPLLRAYNAEAKDHFYTTDTAEFHDAVSRFGGYRDEGVTGYIFPEQEPRTVPLYRLFRINGGKDHLYTTNGVEVDTASAWYINDGIVGYVYGDAACGALPLYRLFSSSGVDHLYTMSTTERDDASKNSVYTQEGIIGYIFPY